MAGNHSEELAKGEGATAFVPLPIRHGDVLRVLGPGPGEAAVAVEPLVKLDQPLTVVQSFVAGLCRADGGLVQPVEVAMVVDPATVVPDKQVPTGALLETFDALPELINKLPRHAGFELLRDVLGKCERIGPVLYCRKRNCVFEARSPNGAKPLSALPADQASGPGQELPAELPARLVSWDGPSEGGDAPALYGGGGGTCMAGPIAPLERLLLDQGKVVAFAAGMEKDDAPAAARLASEHPCVKCPERERCYPPGDGYAYAADRLVTLSATHAPLVFSPLGEWRFDEANRVIGGLSASECLSLRKQDENEFETWLAQRARAMESVGPARLLAGETDGRELIEVARLKLGLIADVLEQLEATWETSGRPHLCWNNETVRVAWRRPSAIPATCWGFQPILRKGGLQPNSPFATRDGRKFPYPPAFSDPAYLPPLAVGAARHFDEPRAATLFIKKPQTGDGTGLLVLLGELGIPWNLFCTSDALVATGKNWQALLMPAAERNPDDGEGLPFHGQATGNTDGLKRGNQIDGVECRWYPLFNQAVDLHAVGMLLFESLVSHDERSVQSFREQMATEIEELTQTCLALPIEQRDDHTRNWVTERCEADAPAAVWTRRNLLHRRDDRNTTRLDAFGPTLWQEIMTFGLRLTTGIPGFSFCADRACAAPRLAGGLLLPLVELRGLIALLDDEIVGRTAPRTAVRTAFEPRKGKSTPA